MLTAILSHLVLYWQVTVWPMEGFLLNGLYLANEYVYFICCVYYLGFTEYNGDAEERFTLGWAFIGFFGLILALNVCIISYQIIKGIIDYCKRRTLKQKWIKVQQERQKI